MTTVGTIHGSFRTAGKLLAVVCAMFALSACEIEQGSTPETRQPGVYKGTADEKLSDAERESLRARGKTAYQ